MFDSVFGYSLSSCYVSPTQASFPEHSRVCHSTKFWVHCKNEQFLENIDFLMRNVKKLLINVYLLELDIGCNSQIAWNRF